MGAGGERERILSRSLRKGSLTSEGSSKILLVREIKKYQKPSDRLNTECFPFPKPNLTHSFEVFMNQSVSHSVLAGELFALRLALGL